MDCIIHPRSLCTLKFSGANIIGGSNQIVKPVLRLSTHCVYRILVSVPGIYLSTFMMIRVHNRIVVWVFVIAVFTASIGAGQCTAQHYPDNAGLGFHGSVSVGVWNSAIRDAAYSGAAFSGWLPGSEISAGMLTANCAHELLLRFSGGSASIFSNDASPLRMSQFDASYHLRWRIGSSDQGGRVYGLLGIGLRWNRISRDYQGYINDRKLSDHWGTADISGKLFVPLGVQGRFVVVVSGNLGISGYFNLDSKWPDTELWTERPDSKLFIWLPGTDAFSADCSLSLQYRISDKYSVSANYFIDGVRWDGAPFWGMMRQGPVISCHFSL